MNRQVGYAVFVMAAFLIAAQFTSSAFAIDRWKNDPSTIAALSNLRGDPARGAILFQTSAAACSKCHSVEPGNSPLGPSLVELGSDLTTEHLVESILNPSKSIRKGYETVRVLMADGQIRVGLVAHQTDSRLTLRDAANLEKEVGLSKTDIEQVLLSKTSMMPEGLVDTFSSDRDFFDLLSYLTAVVQGGIERATELQPDPAKLVIVDDSEGLDHAGILMSLDQDDLKEGRKIFQGHCKNCHGVDGNRPTLPTARAFRTDKLKYGSDPYRMMLTLTKGAGLMAPAQHLSPRQRYQVVHYIREQLMTPKSPGYFEVDDSYLESLPRGTGDGEDQTKQAPRDFGPVLASQIGNSVNSALTFALDDDVTFAYDLHRMQSAGTWTGGFLDLSKTQHYLQRGERMPEINGSMVPGLTDWGWMYDGEFDLSDESKPPRGPVREDWMQYLGHYLHDDRAVVSYRVKQREILEAISAEGDSGSVQLHHDLFIAAGSQTLELSVGQLHPQAGSKSSAAKRRERTLRNRSDNSGTISVSGFVDDQSNGPVMSNRASHTVKGAQARDLDLGTPGRTIIARFRTNKGGTLIASSPANGEWKPGGKTLFVRGKRVVFDIGWVGAIVGKTNVADGDWHNVAVVITDQKTKLFVDGQPEGSKDEFRRPYQLGHVLKIGATASDFGGDFSGDIQFVRIVDHPLSKQAARKLTASADPLTDQRSVLFHWPGSTEAPGQSAVDSETDSDRLANSDETPFRVSAKSEITAKSQITAKFRVTAKVMGDIDGLNWNVLESGRIVLTVPGSDEDRVIRVTRTSFDQEVKGRLVKDTQQQTNESVFDPRELTRGGRRRWPETITVQGSLGQSVNGYALDTIPVPFSNPWNAWIRTSALDFFPDGRAVVTTHGGDVYIVSGIDSSLSEVTWQRYAAGLFEPFGVRVLDGTIYVTCRDGLKRLHDFNRDGEADFVEAFWNDDDVSSKFHAYNFDLQTDADGNFVFAKAGQYTQHHRPGTIMRIPAEGGSAEVVAWGLRTPNGMGKLPGDRFTVSDNQGPWMPAGKISLIRRNGFLGNMPINDQQDKWLRARYGGDLPESFDEPIVWMPQELDNSSGGQLWVDDKRFGPLSGRLLHSSFGKGWLYYLSLQEVTNNAGVEQTQGAIVALPHQWDAGVMRLRANPADGQVYGTGLSGWQGPTGGDDGCLQRLRYAGDPMKMINEVRVDRNEIEIKFSFDVDPQSVTETSSWELEMWDYLWSSRYGSDQFSVMNTGEQGRDRLKVKTVHVIDPKTIRLSIPNLRICDQLSVRMNFKGSDGKRFVEQMYQTIHHIPQ